jgi:hypothetical protein
MKFLPSLKHLFLFFLSSSKDEESKSAREVESGKVVKKLDSRFIMYVDSFLLGSVTVSQ